MFLHHVHKIWCRTSFKPAPDGPNAILNGVACTSASACTAVGNQTLAKTLAERWNGRTWQVQATPNPAGAQNILNNGGFENGGVAGIHTTFVA